ncbi:MAG: hypothetical protein JJT94_12110 [Bernardetiaceae bacterium]|nr:hypothetical protein [Bernardetiaceae bacterium]
MAQKPITYEDVLALFAETDKKIAANATYIQKLTEESAKAEARREAERKKEEARREAERKKMEAERKKMEAAAAASKKDLDKALKRLARQVGEITDNLGRFAEEQIYPRVLDFFYDRGVMLRECYQRVVIKDEHGHFLMEIDLLLTNGEIAVVVEVKHKLKQKDVEEHLERMDKIINYPIGVTRGVSLSSAVAGMIVTEEVANFAMKKGLYVIKPKGNSVEIINAPDFKPKTWKVKS